MPAERASTGPVLGVGIAALDIVNLVAAYPAEDAEVRALGQRIARGGNCANTLDVLAQLGRRCAWVGVLAGDQGADFIAVDLDRRGIDRRHAARVPGGATPTSYITLSRATGSRTIVHHRDLPELTATDFDAVPLADCAWVHFEGRNPAETARMIARVRRERPDVPVSVEIEKPRPGGIEALFRGADVLIFARAYVQAVLGDATADPRVCLERLAADTDARLCLLPWGADGAYGLAAGAAAPVFAPAHPPDALRDSIAAGDVFNAAVIDGLLETGLAAACTGAGLGALLERANRLAGHKCGRDGLDGLVDSARAAALWRGANP
ncbi:MAG: PfkB family carbohydrate kinase [Thiohalocapsa sp.]|jgi:ketohexokinase|uniref:PfkB family carbohydrate kinase n=1 Tax=Thiohalocapsa sp. TaxID=2497641 RepID=UPI0025EA9976|nr:PfkB family carbohydrate kinase [Thiohalocapsa sp.]MCG6939624.1 PfkB family carbohydrate kinase [Thiohalocapsa sp.]